MRAFLVSVDYSDILALTIPYNRVQFDEVNVVTSTADYPNVQKIAEPWACRIIQTDLFYKDGARFNKWAALEFALDVCGREGLICLMDADVVWPRDGRAILMKHLKKGVLYTPRRLIADPPPRKIPPESEWKKYPLHRQEREFAGYSQIFYGDDPHLGIAPWFQTSWVHGGGADSFFQAKWPEQCKFRPPFQVLHLGPAGVNWCGRASAYLDGSKHPQANSRLEELRGYIRKRRHHQPGTDPYAHEKINRNPSDEDANS